MKTKKRKKQYTVAERAEYHANRVDSKNISKSQRMYSVRWLDGYVNAPAKGDLDKFKSQYTECKRINTELGTSAKIIYSNYKKTEIADGIKYGAYIAGAEAKLQEYSSNRYSNKKR